jgi:hypothetical protein
MADEKNYEALLKLSNFIDARLMDIEDNDGVMEQCLVIPIEKNSLVVTRYKTVYCDMYVSEKTFGCSDDNTHYLRQKLTKANREKLNKLGYKAPYLGSMKPSKYKPLYQTDTKYGYERKVKILEDD